jgi:hypothetical protein
MFIRPGRILSIIALLLAVASPVAAADKVVDANKVFPYLEAYLKLPAAERSRFTMAYYLHIGAQPLTAPVSLLLGDRRTPVPLSPSGKVERLPTLAQLADGKIGVAVDSATKFNATIGVEPLMPPAADMDARDLAAAIAQAAVGQRKVGGIMALALPKLKEVAFVGVPSGEVEFADGRRAALPLVKGVPTYNPEALPNAKRIRLPKAPDKLDIG